MHRIRIFLFILSISLVQSLYAGDETDTYKSEIMPFSNENKFEDPDWYNWGGSIIQGKDKQYYLFYSRWPRESSFCGWLTHSEIAVAVSDSISSYQQLVGKRKKSIKTGIITVPLK